MKEVQIPKKNLARSSDPGTKKLKDSELKNRKVPDKKQSASVSELSVESTKDPMDCPPNSQISGAASDFEVESVVLQGLSPDLLSTPEFCLLTNTDESPVSTITSVEANTDDSSTDWIQAIVDLPASVHSLREEINELKKLIYSVNTSEESNWIDGISTMKLRIVLLSFILWAILAAIVIFFSSRNEVAYYGPLPT